MIGVTVHEVYQQQKEHSTDTVVVLKAKDRERYLPIWISFPQAVDIAQRLKGLTTERPTTYNLMAQLVERLGGRVESVQISFLEGTIYHATLRLMVNDVLEEVDCRPSDALALAITLGASISVDAALLEKEGYDGATAFHHDSKGNIHPLEFKEAA
jgi:bifunctional DNase/RNase